MDQKFKLIEAEVSAQIQNASDLKELEAIRVKYMGRKGAIASELQNLAQFPLEQKAIVGKLINDLKSQVAEQLNSKEKALKEQELERQFVRQTLDVTLPGRLPSLGHKHPITQTTDKIKEIFSKMGFQVADGPEIENEHYNFEALNTPEHHPARDLKATFYVGHKLLLRTETSPVQIRVMEKQRPPVRIISPGKVYRWDAIDARRSPMFHQVEGLLVDRHISFPDLKGTLFSFVHQMFGEKASARFRPHYFPFTEPSAELDISCVICHGSGYGCRTCSGEGWLEVGGAGCVHPAVLKGVGYDPEEFTGFAFGMGIDRLAMIMYGINDIRLFFENDLRFLRQF